MALRLSTYYHSEDIPALPGDNLFHSTELFRVLEQTPGYTPVMLVAILKEKVPWVSSCRSLAVSFPCGEDGRKPLYTE